MELEGLFTKIIEKLDTQSEDISIIKVDIAKNTVSLDEHIKRTNLLEENMQGIREEMKPVQRHVDAVNTILKLIGFLAVIVGAITGLARIVKL
jgi:hypothetical protein